MYSNIMLDILYKKTLQSFLVAVYFSNEPMTQLVLSYVLWKWWCSLHSESWVKKVKLPLVEWRGKHYCKLGFLLCSYVPLNEIKPAYSVGCSGNPRLYLFVRVNLWDGWTDFIGTFSGRWGGFRVMCRLLLFEFPTGWGFKRGKTRLNQWVPPL